MRKSARRLARTYRGVNPAVVEKSLGDARHLGRERAIGREHRLLGLAPGDLARFDFWQRRIAIPMREPLLAEPSGLERIVAVREPRITSAYGADERIHDLRL